MNASDLSGGSWLGCCRAVQLVIYLVMNWLKFPRWIHGWVSPSVGGLNAIVFGSIRWSFGRLVCLIVLIKLVVVVGCCVKQ